MPTMDYSFLLGKIKQRGHTGQSFAKALNISYNALFLKLKGKSHFTQDQIYQSIGILGLTDAEVTLCFFCDSKVTKSQP